MQYLTCTCSLCGIDYWKVSGIIHKIIAQGNQVFGVEYNRDPHTRPTNKGNFCIPFSNQTDNKKFNGFPNIKMGIATARNFGSWEMSSLTPMVCTFLKTLLFLSITTTLVVPG